MADLDEHLAELIPVSEWIYNLIKVDYFKKNSTTPSCMKHFVETETHIDSTVQDCWPNDRYVRYEWVTVKADVPRPVSIGHLYGQPVYPASLPVDPKDYE